MDGHVRGLPFRTSAKISDFLTPPVCKFTQPPLQRLFTMSAFEGTPSPLSADVIWGFPYMMSAVGGGSPESRRKEQNQLISDSDKGGVKI